MFYFMASECENPLQGLMLLTRSSVTYYKLLSIKTLLKKMKKQKILLYIELR